MELIKDTIAGLLAEWKEKKEKTKASDPEAWLKKALTKKELGHIKFNTFKNGILNLSVDSSVWLYAVSLKKEELLKKLNAVADKNQKVKDIRFFIGTIKRAN